MSKNVRNILILFVILGVILILVLLFSTNKDTGDAVVNNNSQTTESSDSPALDENASSTSQKFKDFEIIFMTDEEKTALEIPLSYKVQILSRDEDGKIARFKIINNDSDNVTADIIEDAIIQENVPEEGMVLMTEEEKIAKRLNPKMVVQVLARGEKTGEITSYKIISSPTSTPPRATSTLPRPTSTPPLVPIK